MSASSAIIRHRIIDLGMYAKPDLNVNAGPAYQVFIAALHEQVKNQIGDQSVGANLCPELTILYGLLHHKLITTTKIIGILGNSPTIGQPGY